MSGHFDNVCVTDMICMPFHKCLLGCSATEPPTGNLRACA